MKEEIVIFLVLSVCLCVHSNIWDNSRVKIIGQSQDHKFPWAIFKDMEIRFLVHYERKWSKVKVIRVKVKVVGQVTTSRSKLLGGDNMSL